MRADVHRLVEQAQGLLSPKHDLDLATLDRTFSLQFHDAVTTAVGPDLLAAVAASAPGVRLRFLAEAATDTADLRRGQIDLEAGSTEPSAPEVRGELIGHDRLMVAVPIGGSAGHPGVTAALTAAQYATVEHVIVSRRGRGHAGRGRNPRPPGPGRDPGGPVVGLRSP